MPGLRDWVFSGKTFLAAILALYVALALGLERPYWAMASAYIASQPLSGATRSKAIFRLLGTLAGAAAAVALVPALADRPGVLSLALALWVAGCLFVSLLDRTPRSYVCMLAGYTGAIIGFPSVDAPAAIFDTAVTRVEEIALGVGLASLIASVVLPQPVGPALISRIDTWLGAARRWSVEALAGGVTTGPEWRRLAADGVEINLLASYLNYDPASWAARHFNLLRARMVMLIPVLSSIADRMRALDAALPKPVEALAADLAQWVEATSAQSPEALLARIDALQAGVACPSGWDGLLVSSLLLRMRELVLIRTDCETLRGQLAASRPVDTPLLFAPEASAEHTWHRDYGMAMLSSLACAIAILLCCAIWIGTAWNDGFIAAEMVAVACSFFAAQDDPVPSIVQFLVWSIIAVVVDGILLFGVLPVVTDFVPLVVALAVPFVIGGVMVAMPATSNAGKAFTANGATLLALQSTYAADLASFADSSVATVLGLTLAAVVTQLIRSVGAGFSAHRLLRVIWLELAVVAETRGRRDRARYAGLMLDRLGLIALRMAVSDPGAVPVDALTDIRVGFNIIDLRRARHVVPAAVRDEIDVMLDGLARWYRARARQGGEPDAALLGCIDHALDALGEAGLGAAARRGAGAARALEDGHSDALLGLVGIRRGLYPHAPAPVLAA